MDNKKLGNNPFLFLNEHRNNYFGKLNNSLNKEKKNFEGYILEEVFFLEKNIDLIQKQIIMSVYNISNKKFLIKYQKNEKILIVMKYIFNEYAQHLPFNIKEHIIELNNKVCDIVSKDIIDNLEAQEKYIRDSTNQPNLLDRPQNVTSAGNRTLPSISTTF